MTEQMRQRGRTRKSTGRFSPFNRSDSAGWPGYVTRPLLGKTMTSNTPIAPVALPDTRARHTIEKMLEGSGVTLNGDQPWDIRVHHPDLHPSPTFFCEES